MHTRSGAARAPVHALGVPCRSREARHVRTHSARDACSHAHAPSCTRPTTGRTGHAHLMHLHTQRRGLVPARTLTHPDCTVASKRLPAHSCAGTKARKMRVPLDSTGGGWGPLCLPHVGGRPPPPQGTSTQDNDSGVRWGHGAEVLGRASRAGQWSGRRRGHHSPLPSRPGPLYPGPNQRLPGPDPAPPRQRPGREGRGFLFLSFLNIYIYLYYVYYIYIICKYIFKTI